MTSTASKGVETAAARAEDEVSLVRLYVLRAAYLVLIVGLGGMIVPEIVSHPIGSRGIIPALLGGIWVLAFLGLRYPLQMLPLLMFELAWKAIWLLAYGLPSWSTGRLTAVGAEDMANTSFGVILTLVVIPWGHVWRRYVKRPTERWR